MKGQCSRSGIDHVRKFAAYLKRSVNEVQYYPPRRGYRYIVALALYSKCITVAEAVMVLADAGFNDEAFGMTRTLMDIYITLRYISNNDTDERARSYYMFGAKDLETWQKVFKEFWHDELPLSATTLTLAAQFRNPHRWSGKSLRDMALEPDTNQINPRTQKPFVYEFTYKGPFRWASHYVHPTIAALENHQVEAGKEVFVVRSGNGHDMKSITVFNVALSLVYTFISFYRCMGDPQPRHAGKWGNALLKHLNSCHRASQR